MIVVKIIDFRLTVGPDGESQSFAHWTLISVISFGNSVVETPYLSEHSFVRDKRNDQYISMDRTNKSIYNLLQIFTIFLEKRTIFLPQLMLNWIEWLQKGGKHKQLWTSWLKVCNMTTWTNANWTQTKTLSMFIQFIYTCS